MHELSIALSMIEQIEEEAEKHGGGIVEVVYVRIGELSGVDSQALRFAYELASEGTSLATSRLEIEPVRLLVFCSQCNSTHKPDPRPFWGSMGRRLLAEPLVGVLRHGPEVDLRHPSDVLAKPLGGKQDASVPAVQVGSDPRDQAGQHVALPDDPITCSAATGRHVGARRLRPIRQDGMMVPQPVHQPGGNGHLAGIDAHHGQGVHVAVVGEVLVAGEVVPAPERRRPAHHHPQGPGLIIHIAHLAERGAVTRIRTGRPARSRAIIRCSRSATMLRGPKTIERATMVAGNRRRRWAVRISRSSQSSLCRPYSLCSARGRRGDPR